MHHAMADAGDAPARIVAVQPVDQQGQRRLVRRLSLAVEIEVAVVLDLSGRILDLEVRRLPGGADAVDLADQFRLAGNLGLRANSANLIEEEPALRVRIASAMGFQGFSCVWRAP
jgi:hypothetical protein